MPGAIGPNDHRRKDQVFDNEVYLPLAAFPEAPVRAEDLRYIVRCLRQGQCCSLVGVSDTGKSILLKSLCHPEVESACSIDGEKQCLCVFIDLFGTPRTEQDFYGWILHRIIDRLEELRLDEEVMSLLRQWYQEIEGATTRLALRSAFHEAMEVLCAKWKVVLILDEIDDIYRELNVDALRYLVVLRDEFREHLSYITATTHRLEELRAEPALDEFVEMFRGQVRVLSLLDAANARRMILHFIKRFKAEFIKSDIAFIVRQAGGHPALLEATCRRLAEEKAGQAEVDFDVLIQSLKEDELAQDECRQVWEDLSLVEQETLRVLASGASLTPFTSTGVPQLKEMGIIAEADGKMQIFGGVFKTFVAKEAATTGLKGMQFDETTGDIWVDGNRITDELTGLAYALFVVLWRRQGGVCSKDEIAEALWPDALGGITDEQFHKVASHLRKKVGRYLVTVRRRGYRLDRQSQTVNRKTSKEQ